MGVEVKSFPSAGLKNCFIQLLCIQFIGKISDVECRKRQNKYFERTSAVIAVADREIFLGTFQSCLLAPALHRSNASAGVETRLRSASFRSELAANLRW
jgi:hypothetical protein